METILIATIKSWNIAESEKFKIKYSDQYNIQVVAAKEDLTIEYVNELNPKYILFPHWSWIIPREIYENYKCIVFHTADLPYGRGGSPIQNQITRGIYKSKVCAIAVTGEIDAGEIYCSEQIDLSKGSADEILIEVSEIIFKKLMPDILENNPQPYPQEGEKLIFQRRKIEQSNLFGADISDINKLYDFIRMLDGEGYPKAYIELGDYRIEFSSVNKRNAFLEGRFGIYEK